MVRFSITNTAARGTTSRFLVCAALVAVGAFFRVTATPINNYNDTNAVYSPQGSDRFYIKPDEKKTSKGGLRLQISPFYQHAGRARNGAGRSVPMGERLGKWNMTGLFFGQAAAPKAFASYTELNKVFTTYFNSGNGINDGSDDITGFSTPLQNLAKEADYDLDVNVASLFGGFNGEGDPKDTGALGITYEKYGLRGQVAVSFVHGLSLSVKGGLVDYKMAPNFNVGETSKSQSDLTDDDQKAKKVVYDHLFAPTARAKLFGEIGLDLDSVRKTAMEDMHIQLQWHLPQDFRENDELAVTVIPSLAAGMWLPTGKKKDQDRAFSLDTGNGGFYGFTLEGALAFDFPQLMQTNFGGGAIVSASKDQSGYRVPSANPTVGVIKQQGFYPWKTSVNIKPGLTWFAQASLKSEGFSGDLSLFFDYVYTYHQRDSITLKETSVTRQEAFAPGVKYLENESNWKSQLCNIGLDYRITKNLAFGGLVQGMIGGSHVLKSTLVMGTVTFSF